MRRCCLIACILLGMMALGCGRAFYRRSADNESYEALAERNAGPWFVPHTNITPPPQSRLFDPFDPDYPPLPPDDPAAHSYMHRADGRRGYRRWHQWGDALHIESGEWLNYLERDAEGVLRLTPERAVELGILHSREYQTELENLFFAALALTLNRFEFQTQWFLSNNTFFTHTGNSSTPFESNTLTTNTNLGFTKAFTAGSQLLVDFANSFVFEYNGRNTQFVSSGLNIAFTQPLLRGAFRDVRMESLTQGERSLLYALRSFARYRKEFYLDVTTRGQGYLSLLLQLQSIRNQEANLQSLEQSLRMHEALFAAGSTSVIQVDQVFQSYQQGQVALLQSRTNLENALDSYKLFLGLPPELPVKLDDALLRPFQLNSSDLEKLQAELEAHQAKIRQLDEAPGLARLREDYRALEDFRLRAVKMLAEVRSELAAWQPPRATAAAERENRSREQIAKELDEVARALANLGTAMAKAIAEAAEATRDADWERFKLRSRELETRVNELAVLQTQIRVYSVKLKPIPYREPQAIEVALDNRMDLMNQRAAVVDAWRQVTVTANRLEGGLTLETGANINTSPDAVNPFDFSAQASRYRVGVRLDAPLNRQVERNNYRAALINYQRARRAYMARSDDVVRSIRRTLRQLETDRQNFELARQSLIVAARQVEAARERLLLVANANDTTSTLDILNALNSLLTAKNTLIGTWVSYEAGRLQLLLEMEILQVDDRGLYRDDAFERADDRDTARADSGAAQSLPAPVEPQRQP